MHFEVPPLLVVLAAAVAAPLIGELTRRFGISIVVLELSLGILVGPHGLGWAQVEGAVPSVALIGLAFLFFLAGLEIELEAVRGRPITIALAGWTATIATSLVIAYTAHRLGKIDAWLVVAVALSTTALGVLVPMLRDSGTLESPFGRLVMAVGVVGELGPILLMSLLLSRRNGAVTESLLVVAFFAIVLIVAWALLRGIADPPVLRFLRRTMTQSSQLPVRLAVLLLGTLAALAEQFGLDLALGALAAGMIINLAIHDIPSEPIRQKLDGIGFGFLVPIFFITSGMKLEVAAIFGSTDGMLRTAVLVAALVAVRIPLMLIAQHLGSVRDSLVLGLYGATTLSLIVVMTDVAVNNGTMLPAEAGPLVVAGMLSVLLFPALASNLLAPAEMPEMPRPAAYPENDSL
jgi:Kef-type K+ transport system membrane component KefB